MVNGGVSDHQRLVTAARLPSDLRQDLLRTLGLDMFERVVVRDGLRRLI